MNKKLYVLFGIITFLVLIVLAVTVYWSTSKESNLTQTPQSLTEAKILKRFIP
jgi:hypothetical protein